MDLFERLMENDMGTWFNHQWDCTVCGRVAADGKGPGYVNRHRESPQHQAMITHNQSEIQKEAKARFRQRWMEQEGPWLVIEVAEVVPLPIGDVRAEVNWADIEEQWLVSFRQGRQYHIPLPGKPNQSLCGQIFKKFDTVPIKDVHVGVAAFHICDICDSDGALQAREVELMEAEMRTCPYCLGEFKTVGARKEHEEGCGL